MNLSDLIAKTSKPELYQKGTAFMWTDEHISKELLEVHLNPDIDLASRKKSTIEKTVNWILDIQHGKGRLSILDLGCGPGLYTELFAEKGHRVTGVDISKNSIAHAKRSARDKKLDITYLNASYLELELEPEQYDLVVLIFTDLGVLLPAERERLLELVFRVLKTGGTFIFDVLSDKEIKKKTAPKTWEVKDHGFWKGSPYLVLSESFLYPEEKVILYQHTVVDEDDIVKTYRFWTHFFSQGDVIRLLENFNFTDIRTREDILPEGDLWSGDHVIFATVSKDQ